MSQMGTLIFLTWTRRTPFFFFFLGWGASSKTITVLSQTGFAYGAYSSFH